MSDTKSKRVDSNRIRVINKLLQAGYLYEKDIEKAKIEDLLFLNGMNKEDLRQVILLQKAIKKNNVISFLAGTDFAEERGTGKRMQGAETNGPVSKAEEETIDME